MQVIQIPEHIRPWLNSLPPMSSWPSPLKRAILVLAVISCLGAYILLIGGLLVIGSILLELARN